MRNRQIPPEAQLYATAFEAYLRARPDGPDEERAADNMTAMLTVLAEARLANAPVRTHVTEAPSDR